MLIPKYHLAKKKDSEQLRQVAILGSTGSIGTSAIELIKQHPERFQVLALAAKSNIDLLVKQIADLKPKYVYLADEKQYEALQAQVAGACQIFVNEAEFSSVLEEPELDIVLAAIVGMAGLPFVLKALAAGKKVALANKESLVVAGGLVADIIKDSGAELVPVDSEHSALFQALSGERIEDVRNLILTASGGPFLNTPKEQFSSISPQEALKHPKWNMGAKISIDSATLMNKALEVIEAYWLFGMSAEQIEVVIHPQSIVHSLVNFIDGSQIAQLSNPDMKGPIAYALQYPHGRLSDAVSNLDLVKTANLEFFPVDNEKFPAINLAKDVLEQLSSKTNNGFPAAALVLNIANEIAVSAFLEEQLPFDKILNFVLQAMHLKEGLSYRSAEELFALESDLRTEFSSTI